MFAEQAEEAAHLGERLARGVLDRVERHADVALAGVDQTSRAARREHAAADRVLYSGVKLARDSVPLVRDRGARSLLAPDLDLGVAGAPAMHDLAGDERTAEEQDKETDVRGARRLSGFDRRERHRRDYEQRRDDQRASAAI